MDQSPERAYGPHLTVDAYGCPRDSLGDLGVAFEFLDRLPEIIEMEKITKPHVFRHKSPPDPDWGITGVVIIATSHISLHSYPERGIVFMDAFSCREFDEQKAIEFFNEIFKPQRSDVNVTRRGLLFYS